MNKNKIRRKLQRATVAESKAEFGKIVKLKFSEKKGKCAKIPPKGGPNKKPSPIPAPMSPIPLARFSLGVISAIAAEATEIFPPMHPVITLDKTKREKLLEKSQIT